MVVGLDHDVDGFVPLSQLGIENLQTPRQCFEVDQELPLKVIEFDEEQKKIVLSVLGYLKDKDQSEVDAYLSRHPVKEVAIDDVADDQDEEMESWGDEGEPPGGAAEPAADDGEAESSPES